MNKRVVGFSLFLLAVLLAARVTEAATTAGNATVDITVASKTAVDVTPTAISWSNVQPGSITTSTAIELENIGSTTITKIWFNTTHENSNPYGTGTNTNYDAANFLQLANETGTDFYFVNRWEFNQSKWPVYLTLPAGTDSSGRIRVGNHEWFWALDDTDGDGCNATANFYLASDTGSGATLAGAHNETQNGDIDLTDGEVSHAISTGTAPNNDWGYTTVTINGKDYDVVVSHDCTQVVFNHWNKDLAGADQAGTNTAYLLDGNFEPGQLTEAYVRAAVSYGVALGSLQQGWLTVIVDTA